MTPSGTLLPDALSILYPLILVASILATIGALVSILFIRYLWREWGVFRKDSAEIGVSVHGKSDPSVFPHTKSKDGIWAQVFLFIEQAAKHSDDREIRRLNEDLKRLYRENADLRNNQASTTGKVESVKTDREIIEARLRVADADLIKERSIRTRLEERVQGLDGQLKKVLLEVTRTYERTPDRPIFEPGMTDEVVLLRSEIQARDIELEKLKGLLLRAETELRRSRAA